MMVVAAENNPKLHLDADYCKCVPSAFVLPLAAVYVRRGSLLLEVIAHLLLNRGSAFILPSKSSHGAF